MLATAAESFILSEPLHEFLVTSGFGDADAHLLGGGQGHLDKLNLTPLRYRLDDAASRGLGVAGVLLPLC